MSIACCQLCTLSCEWILRNIPFLSISAWNESPVRTKSMQILWHLPSQLILVIGWSGEQMHKCVSHHVTRSTASSCNADSSLKIEGAKFLSKFTKKQFQHSIILLPSNVTHIRYRRQFTWGSTSLAKHLTTIFVITDCSYRSLSAVSENLQHIPYRLHIWTICKSSIFSTIWLIVNNVNISGH